MGAENPRLGGKESESVASAQIPASTLPPLHYETLGKSLPSLSLSILIWTSMGLDWEGVSVKIRCICL